MFFITIRYRWRGGGFRARSRWGGPATAGGACRSASGQARRASAGLSQAGGITGSTRAYRSPSASPAKAVQFADVTFSSGCALKHLAARWKTPASRAMSPSPANVTAAAGNALTPSQPSAATDTIRLRLSISYSGAPNGGSCAFFVAA